jgi:dihydroorotate dehydrogenase (NAD+) catalytic subunit
MSDNNTREPAHSGHAPATGRSDSRIDLSVEIAGVRFRNPVIAASGTFGYGREYNEIFDVSCLGGICTKGLTLHPRQGNDGTRIWETPAGLLNSIGLENPGIEVFLQKELPRLLELGPAVIANLSGSTVEEYAVGAALLDQSSVDMIELNISCPNVKAGGMAFGLDPQAACSVVEPVRRACPHKPLTVKLSPNAPDLTAVARSCVNAGADALSLVNTFKAMAIDIKNRRPVFENTSAGLSGPAIRPIALRMVWELYNALEAHDGKQKIPIIGMGGIACADDALEFLMAGAAAIQVGSATFANPLAMPEIINGIEHYMRECGYEKISRLSIRNKG